MSIRYLTAVVLASAVGATACQNKSDRDLAPIATAVEPAKAATTKALEASIESGESIVSLEMKAPLENIYGVVKDGASGELFVDPSNIQKTTGVIKVNLRQLVLTQEKRANEEAEFGTRQRRDLQNEHARTWLEIADDTPEKERKANEFVTFKITKIADVSRGDVTKLSGPLREVTATVSGDFVLHQRKVEKSAKVKVVFEYEGDTPTRLHMTTVEPFTVDLEAHDVRPRKAFGVLADATLATLGKKVDKHPKIHLDLRAKLSGDS
jgi:hypothetical protein